MTRAMIYGVAGTLIFAFALHAVIVRTDLIRRVIAANVLAAGIFLFFIAMAARRGDIAPDPVPQAMVLTGIVVSISATALGLALARHIHAESGQARLPEDRT